MKTLPKKDRNAKTGSSLKAGSGAGPSQAPSKELRAFRAEAREYRRKVTRLISKPDFRVLAQAAAGARSGWQQDCRKVDGDADRRAALKREARLRLRRQLGRALPKFRQAQALQRAHRAQRARWLRGGLSALAGFDRLGDLPVAPADDVQDFQAPFAVYDIATSDPNGLLAEDDSFILPDSGQIIQNFEFEHNESNWGLISQSNFVSHWASCGADFTMPRRGFVQVGAEIENLANRLTFSITDNFGFSSSTLAVEVGLFVMIGVNGQFGHAVNPLLKSTVSSDGDDVSRSISDLDNTESYAVGMVSTSRISEGEQITVLVGSNILVDSDTDDMDAHVRATYWWHVRNFSIGVL